MSARASPATTFLALLCLALAVLAAAPWLRGPGPGAAPEGARQAATAHPARAVLPLPPLAELRTTVERPLFLASRRPPPSTSAIPGADAKSPLARYRIAGVVIDADRRFALLAELATGKLSIVHEGDALGGTVVESISLKELVLRSGDERTTIAVGNQAK